MLRLREEVLRERDRQRDDVSDLRLVVGAAVRLFFVSRSARVLARRAPRDYANTNETARARIRTLRAHARARL